MTKATDDLKHLRALLQLEYDCEKEAYRRQTEAMGIDRLLRRGDAWMPVRVGRAYYNSLNQPVCELIREAPEDDDHHFEYGRPVCFFTMGENPKKKQEKTVCYLPYAATVSYADEARMVVVLSDLAHAAELQQKTGLGVQLSFDETSYRLMFEATDRVIRAKDGRLAELRELFATDRPAAHLSFPTPPFPWLNSSQQQAVGEVLRAKDVAIVHGPPGTGKTTTLVEAICETLRRETQVLVCAQSNMAVDWISERLVDHGVSVLRIGNPSRVDDKMLSFTYERRFEAHPDYPQLWSIRRATRQLRANRRGNSNFHQKLERLKARATELELRINADLFGEARVIASTLTGAANRLLDGQHFTTLFIDEAAQALEPACWIAIRRCSRVVFAGDHCQLPPTVKSLEALKGGLGRTLMERIAERKPEVVTLLKMQYRMNETIMRFSSDWFYGGMVEGAPEIKNRSILDHDAPMVWVDTSSLELVEQQTANGVGHMNAEEARLTLDALQASLGRISRRRIEDEHIDVAIISPYRAQVQLLRGMLKARKELKPLRSHITINTVDGFQGQERDIVLISLVRANAEGNIGFLRDLRRMNVAMTRARLKLIILGDAATLTRHAFYRKLFAYVQQHGKLLSASDLTPQSSAEAQPSPAQAHPATTADTTAEAAADTTAAATAPEGGEPCLTVGTRTE